MAGHGGRRPGSGRKRRDTTDEQRTRRDAVLRVFNPDRWEKIMEQVAGVVEGGDIYAVLPYLPYILGSPKQELYVTGEITHVRITEIRQALGIRELNAPRKASGE